VFKLMLSFPSSPDGNPDPPVISSFYICSLLTLTTRSPAREFSTFFGFGQKHSHHRPLQSSELKRLQAVINRQSVIPALHLIIQNTLGWPQS
jgi:hypothetical protein